MCISRDPYGTKPGVGRDEGGGFAAGEGRWGLVRGVAVLSGETEDGVGGGVEAERREGGREAGVTVERDFGEDVDPGGLWRGGSLGPG